MDQQVKINKSFATLGKKFGETGGLDWHDHFYSPVAGMICRTDGKRYIQMTDVPVGKGYHSWSGGDWIKLDIHSEPGPTFGLERGWGDSPMMCGDISEISKTAARIIRQLDENWSVNIDYLSQFLKSKLFSGFDIIDGRMVSFVGPWVRGAIMGIKD